MNPVINPLSSEGDLCGQVNQSVRYVHSCPQLTILIKMSTNSPSRKLVVMNLQPNQAFGSSGLLWQKIQEPLTQDAHLLRVLGVKIQPD